MPLDERLLRLIALGASIAANCPACLEHNLGRARACGAAEDEIAQAVEVGRLVRQGAAASVDRLAAEQGAAAAAPPPATACAC